MAWRLQPAQDERYPLGFSPLASRPKGQGRKEGEGRCRSESKAAAQELLA